jgi:hypothetical protein
MIPESSYDRCSPECVVELGNSADAILRLAERVQADLIVLGARRASFWLTHIERGLTPEFLARAVCPVMTVCKPALRNPLRPKPEVKASPILSAGSFVSSETQG